jgi:hypothetical protein
MTEEQMSYRKGSFTLTAFPLRMLLVVPNDATDFDEFGTVRADQAGTVTFLPAHNAEGDAMTMTLAAGEYIPCLVRRVLDTGTDAITLHLVY